MQKAEYPENQALRVGWLIDGNGGPIAVDQVVVIHNGRIRSIQSWRPELSETPGLIELSGDTLLPALMDAHVHLAFSGTLDEDRRKDQLQQTFQQTEQTVSAHLQKYMACGVSAVRDGGDRSGRVLDIKYRQKTPLHLSATCWAWHAPGRYGSMIGKPPDSGQSLSQAVADACGRADHIKLLQSGINSVDYFGRPTAPQFSRSELAAVKQFAESRGVPVMVHANGAEAVRIALDAGCDSIEHGYFMGTDNIRRMADQQVCWVPTLAPMDALSRSGCLAPERADVARRTLEHQMEQVAAAGPLGVRIALGTDAGSYGVDHGTSVRREMRLLMEAGLSLPRAVQCATSIAAELMDLTGRGVLRPGCAADMVAVHGSPDRLPESLANIRGLCIQGRWSKKSKTTECHNSA
jgi:imidazolonepropionase-like amidohydrolase